MTDTTSNLNNDVVYIKMYKKGDYYVCNIDLKRLEENKIREHIRKLLNS
jgi:hypothetical protein